MTVFSGVPELTINDSKQNAFQILDTDFSVLPSDPNLIGSGIARTVVIEELGTGNPTDFFTIEMQAGAVYVIDIDGASRDPSGPSFDSQSFLRDSDGNELRDFDDADPLVFREFGSFFLEDSGVIFVSEQDQTVTLEVLGFRRDPIIPDGADYTINITQYPTTHTVQFVEARQISEDFSSAQGFSRLNDGLNGFVAFFGDVSPTTANLGNPTQFTPTGRSVQRELVTNELDLSAVDRVSFDLYTGGSAGVLTIEEPIAGYVPRIIRDNDGVQLSYRLPGTPDFVDIPSGFIGIDDLTINAFERFEVLLPDVAQVDGVQLRWQQVSNDGNTLDHWAIDNINIGGEVINFDLTPIDGAPTSGPSNFIISPEPDFDINLLQVTTEVIEGSSAAGASITVQEGLAVYDPTQGSFDPALLVDGQDSIDFSLLTITDSPVGMSEGTLSSALNVTVNDTDPGGGDTAVVSILNDWGSGAIVQIAYTLTPEDGTDVTQWTFDIDLADGVFVNGWLNGYNDTVSFDPATGLFTDANSHPSEPSLSTGDTLVVNVQVGGLSGPLDPDDFAFDFTPFNGSGGDTNGGGDGPGGGTNSDLVLTVETSNQWSSGGVVRVFATNEGTTPLEDVDDLAFDFLAGAAADVRENEVWGFSFSNDQFDVVPWSGSTSRPDIAPGETVLLGGFVYDEVDPSDTVDLTSDDFAIA